MNPDKPNTIALKITTAVYLLAAAVLFPFLKTKINPDGIAYLTIAKNYAQGHWQEAVSAYWSPLVSWILAPFSYLPVELLFIFYALNVLLGLSGILVFFKLMKRLAIGPIPQKILLPLCAVFMFRFAFYTSSPDLLSLVLQLFFLLYWLKGGLLQRPYQTALWMVVLYFAKAYNLFFICGLVGFEAFSLLLNKKIRPIQVAGGFIKIFAFFFIIVSPWLYFLQQKYGNLMLAGTASFNHGAAIVNLNMLDKGIPGTEGLRNNYDFFTDFTAPPHNYSVLPWEDPVIKAKYTDYDIFSSTDNFQLQNRVIGKNLQLLFFCGSTMLSMAAIGILSLFACFFLAGIDVLKKGVELFSLLELDISKLLVFNLVYLSGYLLLFIEDRYLWILIISGLLGIGLLAKYAWTNDQMAIFQGKFSRQILLITLLPAGILCFEIIWKHFFYSRAFNAGIGRAEYAYGKTICTFPVEKKRMAHWPDTEDNSLYVSWFTAYFSGGRHYNCLPGEISKANQLISANDINIVFVSDSAMVPNGFIINSWNKIRGQIPDTDVYIKP